MAVHQFRNTTERLNLEPIDKHDADFILEIVNTEGWLKFIGDRNVHSLEDAEKYIDRILNGPQIYYWIAKTKEDQTTVGLITFLKRDYLDYFDLGFAFLPQFANQGYAFEASKSILDFVQSELRHERVAATTIPSNISSIKLLKKLNFDFFEEITNKEEKLHIYINQVNI